MKADPSWSWKDYLNFYPRPITYRDFPPSMTSFFMGDERELLGLPEPAPGLDAAGDADAAGAKKDNVNGDNGGDKSTLPKWASVHGQNTNVGQGNFPFQALYTGPNSLPPTRDYALSETATLYLAARFWELPFGYSEIVFNPEVAGGKAIGFPGVGIAGFPNGEITRVGIPQPTLYIARALWRQTFNLGGEKEKLADGINQAAGSGTRDVNRLTVGFGRMAMTDVFDLNRYANNPKTQFLNWALLYNGAWDYPANVRGYDYGFYFDYNQKYWALRYGAYGVAATANSANLDRHFLQGIGHGLEWEGRWSVDDMPGKIRLLAWLNRARMGNYREAVEEMPVDPNITLTRTYRLKYGFGVNFEQEITKDVGVFGRAGWDNGQAEAFMFTAIDLTFSGGILAAGKSWSRPNDTVGIAGVVNGISSAHQAYLAAGGLDFIIGDGKLNYAPEEIFELFYNWSITQNVFVTANYQFVEHPAYNRDRGPVSIVALRVYLRF